ncbi:MAG TPA: glucose 1-dehydrogenase [Candidatus Angelobacter sp.]|jgi:NAD(P)-dependent dehydrogenase (short-subunit alcohol dehydrogenase family)|nr:glucose 1-dehydrogenase [Candidatus Angelobacter sp.]
MNGIFDLEGRVAVVTGASSGLGQRFARVLHGNGASVVLAARRLDRIEQVAAELGADRAMAVRCDVREEADVVDLVRRAAERFGRLDVMVNNAGTSKSAPGESEPLDDFRAVLETNLVGVFTGCREAARVMLEQGSGSIVNVASVLGLVGNGRVKQGSYAASKGAVVNLTRELAAQWARRGVRVNAIAPGWFHTELNDEMFAAERALDFMERSAPMGRTGREGELDGVLLLLASDAGSFITGQTIAVDGGWTAV